MGIGKLKKLVKFLDDMRKGFTKPWRDAAKETNDKCNDAMEPLNKVIGQGVATVRTWDDKQERIQREAEEKARKEQEEAERKAKAEEERRRKISIAKGGSGEVAPVAPAPVEKIVPYAATMSTTYRKNWGFEITNFGIVPSEYKLVDSQKVKAAMDKDKDGDPTAVIPGIKWVNNPTRVR
ncbi:MAG: hypothetical protein V3U75_04110 [Methylococcaceae bacterium]